MDCSVHDELPAPKVAYHYPDEQDIDYIVMNLREEDRRELEESPLRQPNETLLQLAERSVQSSGHVWVVRDHGIPFLLFGCLTVNEATGCPWLFGTNLMQKHSRRILRQAPRWFDHFGHTAFLNLFDTRNTAHIRWAYHLGFRPWNSNLIDPTSPYQLLLKVS